MPPLCRQNVITRDNVAIDIDSVIVYHIVSPHRAAYGIADVRSALIERAQTTLRHVVGSRNLQNVSPSSTGISWGLTANLVALTFHVLTPLLRLQLLTDREAVASEIETIVESVSEKWGVSIESILIKVSYPLCAICTDMSDALSLRSKNIDAIAASRA